MALRTHDPVEPAFDPEVWDLARQAATSQGFIGDYDKAHELYHTMMALRRSQKSMADVGPGAGARLRDLPAFNLDWTKPDARMMGSPKDVPLPSPLPQSFADAVKDLGLSPARRKAYAEAMGQKDGIRRVAHLAAQDRLGASQAKVLMQRMRYLTTRKSDNQATSSYKGHSSMNLTINKAEGAARGGKYVKRERQGDHWVYTYADKQPYGTTGTGKHAEKMQAEGTTSSGKKVGDAHAMVKPTSKLGLSRARAMNNKEALDAHQENATAVKQANPTFSSKDHAEAAKHHEKMGHYLISASSDIRGATSEKFSNAGSAHMTAADAHTLASEQLGGSGTAKTQSGKKVPSADHAKYDSLHEKSGDMGKDALSRYAQKKFPGFSGQDHRDASDAHYAEAQKHANSDGDFKDAASPHLDAAFAHHEAANAMGVPEKGKKSVHNSEMTKSNNPIADGVAALNRYSIITDPDNGIESFEGEESPFDAMAEMIDDQMGNSQAMTAPVVLAFEEFAGEVVEHAAQSPAVGDPNLAAKVDTGGNSASTIPMRPVEGIVRPLNEAIVDMHNYMNPTAARPPTGFYTQAPAMADGMGGIKI